MYFQNEGMVAKGEGGKIEEGRQPRGSWFYVVLIILVFGPIALGLLGAGIMSLNDALGFTPISKRGLIAGLLWIPIISLATWPIAALLIVVAAIWAVLKKISK